jgi:hypothetical protein
MTIDITLAKIGRLMKKLENTAVYSWETRSRGGGGRW